MERLIVSTFLSTVSSVSVLKGRTISKELLSVKYFFFPLRNFLNFSGQTYSTSTTNTWPVLLVSVNKFLLDILPWIWIEFEWSNCCLCGFGEKDQQKNSSFRIVHSLHHWEAGTVHGIRSKGTPTGTDLSHCLQLVIANSNRLRWLTKEQLLLSRSCLNPKIAPKKLPRPSP
jgi:hypothetical protein